MVQQSEAESRGRPCTLDDELAQLKVGSLGRRLLAQSSDLMSCESLRSSGSGAGGVRFGRSVSQRNSSAGPSPRTTTPVRTVNSPRPSPSPSFENSNARYPSRRSLHDSVSSRPETPNSTGSGRSHTLVEGRLLLNDLDTGNAKEHGEPFVHLEEDRALLWSDVPLELFGQPVKESPRRRNVSPLSPRREASPRKTVSSPARKKRMKHPPRKKLLKDEIKKIKDDHRTGFGSFRLQQCLQVFGQPARVESTDETPLEDFNSQDFVERTSTAHTLETEVAAVEGPDEDLPPQPRSPTLAKNPEGHDQIPSGGKAMGEHVEADEVGSRLGPAHSIRDWKNVPIEIRGFLRRIPSHSPNPRNRRQVSNKNDTRDSTKGSTDSKGLSLTESNTDLLAEAAAEKMSVEVQCSSSSEDDLEDSARWAAVHARQHSTFRCKRRVSSGQGGGDPIDTAIEALTQNMADALLSADETQAAFSQEEDADTGDNSAASTEA
eukprot:Skav216558  [mRNA]  locus=scaffold1776:444972:449608:- [translate_table: standard]